MPAADHNLEWLQVLALQMVSALAARAPERVQKEMPAIVPAVAPTLTDSKKEVAEQAFTTLGDAFKVCGAAPGTPACCAALFAAVAA